MPLLVIAWNVEPTQNTPVATSGNNCAIGLQCVAHIGAGDVSLLSSLPPSHTPSSTDAMPKYRATVRDHPDWREGDFTLISADGWRFKVLSAYVMSSR